MKRRNINKTIMQRGGLMIEALAMLGLIAVVTPTMYKKSAERTMEVEDINTAATIRTVMNAANDYVSSNYSWLISQMNANGQTVRDITAADIGPFLPYGFNLSQPLHNYNAPILKVKRPSTDSNNLTAFALFPAKAADPEDGIGQERTSRIAALVGSNGGYKPTENTARGVGGIWSLNEGDFRDVFGNEGNQYSIVTASTDIINSATNNEVDMTKYLQRGSDNAPGTEWKNTMRTDLYMGGPNQDGDIYENLTGPYSIRNIKSLIVGTNAGEETGNYGLYIAPEAANPNAYVHGSLKAGEGQFKADNANLQFGGTEGAWNFVVSNVGKVMNRGDLELASDSGVWNDIKIGALRNNGSNKYLIQGSRGHAAASGGTSEPYDYGSLTFIDDLMKLTGAKNIKDKKVKIMENGWAKDEDGNAYEDIKYQTYVHSSEDAGIPEFPVEIDANAKVKGLLAAGQIDTNKIRTASLSVGSEYVNSDYQWMTVDKDGVLIADPSRDTDNPTNTKNRINVNKDQIVLSVDKEAKNVNNPRGLSGDVRDHGQETSSHDVQIVMNAKTYKGEEAGGFEEKDASIEIKAPNTSIHGDSTTVSGKGTLVQAGNSSMDYGVVGNNLNDNSLLMRNDNMQIRMTDKETLIGPRPVSGVNASVDKIAEETENANKYKVRTVFDHGNLDLLDSNLNILNADKYPVFSVGTNEHLDDFKDSAGKDAYYNDIATSGASSLDDSRGASIGIKARYDIAMHGSTLFTSEAKKKDADEDIKYKYNRIYMSIGKANSDAAINIVGVNAGVTTDPAYVNPSRTLVVDTSDLTRDNYYDNFPKEFEENKKKISEPGTIYIRKGYLEAVGSHTLSSAVQYDSAKDGKGVIVASRFVANNPDTNADAPSSFEYGKVPDVLKFDSIKSYNGQTSDDAMHKYDTYMVNPAYTSVMHDIKLTTRGGARLSDVLPDFINKGIYVVTNSLKEQSGDTLNFSIWPEFGKTEDKRETIKFSDKIYTEYAKGADVTLGADGASPFLGVVPAPQCPPGYGRVITLNPASFRMAEAGSLKKRSEGLGYYVLPPSPNEDQISQLASNQIAYKKAKIIAGGNAEIEMKNKVDDTVTLGTISKLDDIGTEETVLTVPDSVKKSGSTDSESSSPTLPLMFQQSTWLKSQITPLKDAATSYVRGWAAVMGFIYPNGLYEHFTGAKKGYMWNVFPVVPRTLEGYATVYCYFNRTNMEFDGESGDFNTGYNRYVDSYDYMVTMKEPPKSSKKVSGSSAYQERLNDPELKYNDVW